MNKILQNILHNPKTTLTGVACGLAMLLAALGIIPQSIAAAVIAVAGGGASGALILHANDPKKDSSQNQ